MIILQNALFHFSSKLKFDSALRMEKKLLPTHISTYIAARLVEGKSRWHITYTYTDGYTGLKHRPKPTYNLNRIKSVRERRKAGNEFVKQINELLPLGWPWKVIKSEQTVLSVTPFFDAIDIAMKIKCAGKEAKTVTSYISMMGVLLDFVRSKYKKLTIGGFTKKHALAFSDYLIVERKTRKGTNLTGKTYNSYIIFIKSAWKELSKRDYTHPDVWKEIGMRKETEKIPRDYSKKELQVIIRRVAEKDVFLLLAIVLEYYCFIRPSEITRLRVRHMKIKDARITLPGEITKNDKNRSPTIPNNVLEFIASFNFEKRAGGCYVFGRKRRGAKQIHICPDFPVSYKTFNNRLQVILRKLKNEGLIDDIKGMTFYGLKDTGGQDLIDQGVDVWQIMKQMGHSSLKQTQIYLERRRKTNPAIQEHQTNILNYGMKRSGKDV